MVSFSGRIEADDIRSTGLDGCSVFRKIPRAMTEIILALVPLLLLVTSLLFGHYPGCDTIVRLAERFASRSRSRSVKHQLRPFAPHSHAASGGLLIAFGLAQRPPPLAL
jgi:hypothetical protein